MTLKSSSAKWSEKHRCYRVRFWESGISDTYAKVPDDYWPTVFRAVPKTEPAKESVRADYILKANEWAATERKRREQVAIDTVRGVASTKMTIRQTFDLYQREACADLNPKTLRLDESMFRTAICRHIDADAYTPESIDEPMLKMYVNARKQDHVYRIDRAGKVVDLAAKVRHRTVNDEVALLTKLARFAWNWRSKTGCDGVRLPDKLTNILLQKQNSLQVALTEEEVTALLEVASPLRRRMLIFGLATGLREGNLYGLRGEWIDWPNAMLRIPAEFMKGGRKARDLIRPLPSIAMDQLGSPRLAGLIWPNAATGLPYTRIGLDRMCAKAKIPAISEHDMRTTLVTWLRMHKVDALVVKALVGHASASPSADCGRPGMWSFDTGDVTDLYTKVMAQSMNEANEIVDAIFRRILGPQQLRVVSGAFGG